MGATTRHCLVLLAAAALIFLVAWPGLAATAAAWQGRPWTADWSRYLGWWSLASGVLCGLRLLLAAGHWLLHALLRSY